MMTVGKRAGGRATALLGMALAAMCATAQTTPPGSGSQTGSGAAGAGGPGAAGAASPAAGAQGPGQMPGSSAEQGPVTATTGADHSGPAQAQQKPSAPEKNKLAQENGDLTFLPELKPTDGVPVLAEQPNGDAQLASESAEMHQKPLLLDRAVAVINGKVILASEVREMQRFAVFEPLSALGGEFTPMEAMRQIMNRTLLLDQMQEQELTPPPSDAEVDDQIALLRKHIPACGQSCETEEGWQRFLKAQGLTEAEFRTRWQQRLAILDFVRVRFRTGIRITKPEIETYYKEQLVPEFAARKLKPPPLAQVSDRIEEVLLEQHVNVLLEDYLRSLKDAGSVLILDRQYNSLGSSPSSGTGGGGDVPPPSGNGGEQ
jgi:peptidyl-prolyl cis-trans isomerase SurA